MDALLRETAALFAEKETEGNWSRLNDQLKRWTEVFASPLPGSGGHEATNLLLDAAHKLQAPVTQSALSLRSSLSATACGLVAAMATRLGTAFAPQMDVYGSTLVELCGRSNKLFNRYAEQAMLVVLAKAKSLSLVGLFVMTLRTSKSSAQRMYCATFIEHILLHHTAEELMADAEAADILAEGVLLCLNDGDEKTRLHGRTAYGLLEARAHERAHRVFAALDDKKQMLLVNALASAAATAQTTSGSTSQAPKNASTGVAMATTTKSSMSMGLPSRPKFEAQRAHSGGNASGDLNVPTAPATPAAQRTYTLPSVIPSTPARSTAAVAPMVPLEPSIPSTPSAAQSKPKRVQLGAAMRTVRTTGTAPGTTGAAPPPSNGPATRKLNPNFFAASREVIAITISGSGSADAKKGWTDEPSPSPAAVQIDEITMAPVSSETTVQSRPEESSDSAVVTTTAQHVEEPTVAPAQLSDADIIIDDKENESARIADALPELVTMVQSEPCGDTMAASSDKPITAQSTATVPSLTSLLTSLVQGKLEERVDASEKLLLLYKTHGQSVLDQLRSASETLAPSRRLPLLHLLDQVEQGLVEVEATE